MADVVKPYPRGERGHRYSLDECARRIAADRLTETVKAWARKTIYDAGGPMGNKARAQAILDAFRREWVWVPDPLDAEDIAPAHKTVGDDKVYWGGDCDDATVALGAALASVGIPVLVVGVGYTDRDGPGVLSHVLLWAWDSQENRWVAVEGSVRDYPVGVSDRADRERVIEPLSGKVLCDASACMKDGRGIPPDVSYLRPEGDFVGVSGFPIASALADETTRALGLGSTPGATLGYVGGMDCGKGQMPNGKGGCVSCLFLDKNGDCTVPGTQTNLQIMQQFQVTPQQQQQIVQFEQLPKTPTTLDLNDKATMLAVFRLIACLVLQGYSQTSDEAKLLVQAAKTDANGQALPTWTYNMGRLWQMLLPDPNDSQVYRRSTQPNAAGLCAMITHFQSLGFQCSPDVTTILVPWATATCQNATGTVVPTEDFEEPPSAEPPSAKGATTTSSNTGLWIFGGLVVAGIAAFALTRK